MADQVQQVSTNAPPSMQGLEGRQYSESHYKFLAGLIDSVSARSLFEQIVATNFSMQCILAFHKVLTSGFDKSAILAYNQNLQIRIKRFEVLLNLMVIECYESDTQNPAFLTFQKNILDTFIDFVSRSQDAEERKRLLMTEYHISQPQQEEKKPGLLGMGTR